MTPASDGPALRCSDLVVDRSGANIINGVSIEASPGEITVILGPNGAGKTTLLEAISGLIPIRSGEVHLHGRDFSRATVERHALAGLAHVEQGRPVFGELTVEENLMVSVPKRHVNEAYSLFPELEALAGRRAAVLSGGEQQMLVIARALLRRPTVILLDEISLGLAPIVVNRIIPRLREVVDSGIAVVLVEQFARLALQVGDHAYVMAKGTIEFDGGCDELLASSELLSVAYFRAELPKDLEGETT